MGKKNAKTAERRPGSAGANGSGYLPCKRCGGEAISVRLTSGGRGRMVRRHHPSYSPCDNQCLVAGQKLFEEMEKITASKGMDAGKLEALIVALKAEVETIREFWDARTFEDPGEANRYLSKFLIGIRTAQHLYDMRRKVAAETAETPETPTEITGVPPAASESVGALAENVASA